MANCKVDVNRRVRNGETFYTVEVGRSAGPDAPMYRNPEDAYRIALLEDERAAVREQISSLQNRRRLLDNQIALLQERRAVYRDEI